MRRYREAKEDERKTNEAKPEEPKEPVSARELLERFWGHSNGGDVAWKECFDAMRALDLTRPQIQILRLRLPVTTGLVGQRVKALEALLEELQTS